jgi:hypothetical protein
MTPCPHKAHVCSVYDTAYLHNSLPRLSCVTLLPIGLYISNS